MNNYTFGEHIYELRKERGLTQGDIAAYLGISDKAISKWENGINEPDFETLKKLCIILDCSITELIDSNHEVVTSREEKDKKLETKLFYWNQNGKCNNPVSWPGNAMQKEKDGYSPSLIFSKTLDCSFIV